MFMPRKLPKMLPFVRFKRAHVSRGSLGLLEMYNIRRIPMQISSLSHENFYVQMQPVMVQMIRCKYNATSQN